MGIDPSPRPHRATTLHRGAFRSTRRDDLTSVVFDVWMVGGLFVDGWAHVNQPGLETFFTPWHGVLYSGFAGGAAWIGLLAARGHRCGLPWTRSFPAGYQTAAVGVMLFGLGGLADMAWHVRFGVEVGIEALLSPTHLILLVGGGLLFTAPLRATWLRPRPSGAGALLTELPAVLSLALVTALAGFFLLYLSVFSRPAAAVGLTAVAEGAPGHEEAEMVAAAGMGGYIVTTLLLVGPVLLAQRVDRRPPGLILAIVAAVAWLSISVAGFTAYGLAAASAVSLAAAGVEILVPLVKRSGLPVPLTLAAAIPTALWPSQLVAVAVTTGVRWPLSLSSGIVVLSALTAVTFAVVVSWIPANGGPTASNGASA